MQKHLIDLSIVKHSKQDFIFRVFWLETQVVIYSTIQATNHRRSHKPTIHAIDVFVAQS